jgi:DNA-binding winged helix-turn-helix (wHTH) protein
LAADVKYFAPFRIDLAGRSLWRDEARVPLTHKAFDLLRVLVDRAGHVVSKETLMDVVWPNTHVHPDNVKVLIGEIRRALADDPVRPRYIRSIVKRGYVFIAPVVEAPVDLSTTPVLPIFVGREREMDALVAAFDAVWESDRRVVFVTGESGIGKTALCEAFLRLAVTRRAMRATWSQCLNTAVPAEPYYPLLDALTRLARSAGDELVGSILAKQAPSWLTHLPALAEEQWRAMAGARVTSAARMLREIVMALEALAEDLPLVLWLEDLHWADPATVDVIASLAQRRDPAKLLLLATMRAPETVPGAAALRRAQADLLAHGGAMEIRLHPLGNDEIARYLDLRLGGDVARRATSVLGRSTSGHPLFLATAVDHLVRKGHIAEAHDGWRLTMQQNTLEAAIPASLAGIVTHELDELAADEREAIEAASVVGVEFSLWLAAHAANVDELALEPVLEVLARRETFIVREGVTDLAGGLVSPLYRFKHGLYQEIVVEHASAAMRTEAHTRVALAMERLFAGREQDVACDLAFHFHGAGDHARAARYLRLAAANAMKRYAAREAVALLHGAVKHASHLPDDQRVDLELPLMLELGQAQFTHGEAEQAAMTWTRLARRAEEQRRPNERLRGLIALTETYAGSSRDKSLVYMREIAAAAPLAMDRALAASAAIRAGIIELMFMGWSDETADRCAEAWRSVPRTESDEHRSLAIRLLLVQNLRTAYASVWTTGRRLLPLALRSGDITDCIYCYFGLSMAALHLGRWGDARDMATEGTGIAEKAGSARLAVTMRLMQAWVALEAQRWDEARVLSLADRALSESAGWPNTMQMSLLFCGAAALGRGDLDDAAADLERLNDVYARGRVLLDWFWEIQLHGYLTELALRRRDLERATAEAAAGQATAIATSERTWRARAHAIAAQVAIERQAFADADRHLRQARREIRGIDAPLASWRVEAVTATLLERTAQPDSAERARLRYERTLGRLERSMQKPPAAAPPANPLPRGEQIH